VHRNLFLSNKPDAPINPILFCYKTLHVSGIFSAHGQFSTVHRNLFLSNKPDAPINPILFCYKTLHVSGIFSAHRQEFSTVHSALVSFMQVFDYRFQAESGWNCQAMLVLQLNKQIHSVGCSYT